MNTIDNVLDEAEACDIEGIHSARATLARLRADARELEALRAIVSQAVSPRTVRGVVGASGDDRAHGILIAAAELRDRLAADARALWAVRVLDRWTAIDPAKRSWMTTGHPAQQFSCKLTDLVGRCEPARPLPRFVADTPDAARIAAADALVAEDPSLGEGL
jgi:hypothetical protein